MPTFSDIFNPWRVKAKLPPKWAAVVNCPECKKFVSAMSFEWYEAGVLIHTSLNMWDTALNWTATEHNRLTGHKAIVEIFNGR